MNAATHPRGRVGRVRGAVSSGIRWASYLFLFAGLLAVGYAGYLIADAQIFQAVQLHRFDHRAPLSEPHLPVMGEVLGRIEISSLALRTVILQGDSPEILRRGVGHVPGTPMPGERGNIALAGHRDTFFRPLRQIRPGDVIALQTFAQKFEYRVQSTSIVSPADTQVLESSEGRELTLVTCFPFDYVGAAPNRFIVRAIQVASD
jgi:sortase A